MSDHQPNSSKPVEDSPINLEYDCAHCSRGFDANMAHQITVDETGADIMCPWCKHTATYEPPAEIERPPAIVTTSIVTKEDAAFTGKEFTTARVFFEGGAWLEYCETFGGRVREQMFNADGTRIEAFHPEFEYDDTERAELYGDPEEYLQRAVDLYEKYTVRGLKIQMPHVAAVLIDGH